MRVKKREPEASAAFPEEMILELDLGRCVRYMKENLKWKKRVHGATEVRVWGRLGQFGRESVGQ